MHDLSLITLLAAALAAAWACGLLTQGLGLSPVVGYLLAGVLIGPHTPGYSGDVALAQQLAEVGVILLMFGVGMHFHLADLVAVWRTAVPGAIGQSAAATLLAVAVAGVFGWPLKSGLVLGIGLSVASTVILIRMLTDAKLIGSEAGHVAVGWLIVEDILTVVALVLIPALAASPNATPGLGELAWLATGAVAKLALMAGLLLWLGSRLLPRVMLHVTRLRSRELFTLTVLVMAITVAAGTYELFGASMALGAFLGGMLIGQSTVSRRAAADILPMRDAFGVLFFTSVGMLFDPAFLVREPLLTLACLAIVVVGKPVAALLIVALLGRPPRLGLTVALGLAQIGEFSFIVSQLGRTHGLLGADGHSVLVAVALLSITLNPILFRNLDRIEAGLRARPRVWGLLTWRTPGA